MNTSTQAKPPRTPHLCSPSKEPKGTALLPSWWLKVNPHDTLVLPRPDEQNENQGNGEPQLYAMLIIQHKHPKRRQKGERKNNKTATNDKDTTAIATTIDDDDDDNDDNVSASSSLVSSLSSSSSLSASSAHGIDEKAENRGSDNNGNTSDNNTYDTTNIFRRKRDQQAQKNLFRDGVLVHPPLPLATTAWPAVSPTTTRSRIKATSPSSWSNQNNNNAAITTPGFAWDPREWGIAPFDQDLTHYQQGTQLPPLYKKALLRHGQRIGIAARHQKTNNPHHDDGEEKRHRLQEQPHPEEDDDDQDTDALAWKIIQHLTQETAEC